MIKKLVLFAFIFLLVGCNAARKVNLTKQSESINLSENSIVLISLELTRSSPSRFIPLPIIVKLTKINAENKEETINVAVDKDAGEAVNQSGNSFLIRIELPPGHYQLHSVVGRASAFPLNGFFNIPFLLETDLPANSVVYLGKIHANLRPRVGDEFRAG